MRRLLAAGLLVIAACGSGDPEPTDRPPAADPPRETTQRMRWHAQSGKEGDVAESSAVLRTDDDGASITITTSELNAGHAYTVWWVVVNNPSACAAKPCSPDDVLKNPATRSQVTYATGQVVEDVSATFEATLDAGAIADGWYEDIGLDDPRTAEIHAVLNDHGERLDEFVRDQVNTYRGGCTDESLPPAFPDTAKADGKPGPNTCRLWQSVAFQQPA